MMTTATEETFTQEVLASSVPVLVHFQAPWCGVCRLITPILNQAIADWPVSLRLINVNADENFKLANRYKLQTLPTLLYIEGGKIVHRMEGIANRDDFRHCLESIAGQYGLETVCSSRSAVGELQTLNDEL